MSAKIGLVAILPIFVKAFIGLFFAMYLKTFNKKRGIALAMHNIKMD